MKGVKFLLCGVTFTIGLHCSKASDQDTTVYQHNLPADQQITQIPAENAKTPNAHYPLISTYPNNGQMRTETSPFTYYFDQNSRLQSYKSWPVSYIDPNQLALAGFYYTGHFDVVTCPYCGINLRDWQPGDDPLAEHKRFSQNCGFVQALIEANEDGKADDKAKESPAKTLKISIGKNIGKKFENLNYGLYTMKGRHRPKLARKLLTNIRNAKKNLADSKKDNILRYADLSNNHNYQYVVPETNYYPVELLQNYAYNTSPDGQYVYYYYIPTDSSQNNHPIVNNEVVKEEKKNEMLNVNENVTLPNSINDENSENHIPKTLVKKTLPENPEIADEGNHQHEIASDGSDDQQVPITTETSEDSDESDFVENGEQSKELGALNPNNTVNNLQNSETIPKIDEEQKTIERREIQSVNDEDVQDILSNVLEKLKNYVKNVCQGYDGSCMCNR